MDIIRTVTTTGQYVPIYHAVNRLTGDFVLEITKPPDPQIAIVLGDLLFNIRSALDHIAVACAPANRRRQAGFPLYDKRPEGDDQKKFESMTRGMASEALAVIEYEQPYNVQNRASNMRQESVEALFALNALQDADKHRSLAVLVAGISDPKVQVTGAVRLWDFSRIHRTRGTADQL